MALEVQQSVANVERMEKIIFFRIGKASTCIQDLDLCYAMQNSLCSSTYAPHLRACMHVLDVRLGGVECQIYCALWQPHPVIH